ncbi:3-oxoacyl-[acyl-carrier-protein] reductase FabG-like [Panonychus citri]|uniref:3-oxoacyl-[acyl-carrier-protein] reductase FabG-like n=1 Tax=Panonychus citri TaxID=50023 RepID=UPI0023071A6E|nr:3-oxoacyl-[acyl-carrier-protein] reductase FabG-like [Panonychus citri]
MINLTGKVALITGSSDGIGAATAILFSSLGAKVAIVGRTQSKLDKVSSECQSKSPNGLKPIVIQADFEKDEDVKRTFDETIKAYNQLDILVNNAGVACQKRFAEEGDLEDYDRVMQVNVRSVILLTKLAKDHLARAKGSIVNVSSIAGIRMSGTFWSYCMTKAALDMFTKSMASLLSPEIRVNSVNPGPVRTNFLNQIENPNSLWDLMATTMPLQRVGVPDDIAQLIAFLASDAAKNITGSIVVSDSGSLVADPHKTLASVVFTDENKQG